MDTETKLNNWLRELMQKDDELRAEWLKAFGNDAGFDAWFTEQVKGVTR